MSTKHESWVAVADLHGHLKQFEALLAFVDREYGNHNLCTLGDYVDNGPDIPGLLDRLITLHAERGDRIVSIMGNHDLALLRSLGWPGMTAPDPEWFSRWQSRYWDPGLGTPKAYNARDLTGFARKLPSEHVEFLARLPWFHDTGRYLFVHAGMKPGDLAPQRRALRDKELPPEKLFLPPSIRDKKLSKATDSGWNRIVVSAHNKSVGTPGFTGANRICLSAEVDATQVLRAVVLPEQRWLEVGPRGAVEESSPP